MEIIVKESEKVREIPAIEEGTVIDHIPPEQVFRIVGLLNISDQMMTIGTNFSSIKCDKKAIVKIANKFLSESEVNKISLLAPKATVSKIENYRVVGKMCLQLQKTIEAIIKCSNPNCITNCNPVTTRFSMQNATPLKVKCTYCERIMNEEEVNTHLL